MKILHLKYKMHKFVNLIFYLIIFGIGFVLGFSVEKINFNKLISQFLFIDSVSAEEVIDEQEITYVCRDSYNIVNFNNLEKYTSGGITFDPHYTDGYLDYVSVSGTCTSTVFYSMITNLNFTSGDWIVSGNLSEVEFFAEGDDATRYKGVIPSGKTIVGFYMRVQSGTQLDVRVYPMVRLTTSPSTYEPYGKQFCYEEKDNSFYNFSQDIFGEVGEENKFIYDFITFGLIVTCFTLFVLIVGYIFNKFFGG